MSDAADQRFAPPQAHVADVASGEIVLAGRGTRFWAALVDGIIVACVIWVLFMIPVLRTMIEAQAKESLGIWHWNPLSLIVGVVGFLAVQGWPLVMRGQTVGKMLFKLRIVRSDGSRPEAWRLLGLRYGIGMLLNVNAGVSMIYGLLDSLLIFRESRKCLHDSIADTQVIKL